MTTLNVLCILCNLLFQCSWYTHLSSFELSILRSIILVWILSSYIYTFFYLCWLHIHKRSRLTALFDWSCSNSTCWSFTAYFLCTANQIARLSNVTHSARETKHSQNIECINLYSSKNNIIKHLFIPQQFINLLKKFNKYYLNI